MAKSIIVPGSSVPIYDHGNGIYRPYPVQSSTLFSIAATPPVFLGSFLVNPNTYGLSNLTYTGRCKIAKSKIPGRMYLLGNNDGTGGHRFFGEAAIPALVNTGNPSAMNIGAVTQGYRHIRADFTYPYADVVTSGMYYHAGSDRLFVSTYSYYINNTTQINLAHYTNPTDLSTATRTGPYAAGGAAESAGYFVEIPSAWQSSFGGATHMMCGGVGAIPRADRQSCGPSAFLINPSSAESGGATPVLNYPYGTSAVILPGVGSNDWGASPGVHVIFNTVSEIAGAFIIPGTQTLMYIGMNWNGVGEILYKGTNDLGQLSGGYDTSLHDAKANYYWLYDLQDLANSYANPATYPVNETQPYEHGFFPDYPGGSVWNKLIGGAFFDYETSRMYVSTKYGASPRYSNGTPSFSVFQF